ncbi:MAG TPA: SDR family NAD(P)-dependent oxidoreductase [Acidimicrobiales bacterium]|nr:SDR family NAD(P)-dependent oxidoreductase [Acidimicrobiales bacterium]
MSGRAGQSRTLRERYGPAALVVGGSEGLGAAWAEALAAAGLDLILVARRQPVLEALAADLADRHAVSVETVAADARSGEWLQLAPLEGVAGREIGFVVANAALSPIGPFVDAAPLDLLAAVELNVSGAVRLASAMLPAMADRGRGAFVLMSSLAGLQGSPHLATYAGTKAFLNVFGEGLWAELRPRGVDVLVCAAGAVSTPGYRATTATRAPGTLDPRQVVAEALAALGRTPRVIPGWTNKTAAFTMGRLLPRRAAVAVMGRANARLDAPRHASTAPHARPK